MSHTWSCVENKYEAKVSEIVDLIGNLGHEWLNHFTLSYNHHRRMCEGEKKSC